MIKLSSPVVSSVVVVVVVCGGKVISSHRAVSSVEAFLAHSSTMFVSSTADGQPSIKPQIRF